MIPFELVSTVGGALLGGALQLMAARANAINDMMAHAFKSQEANSKEADKADKRGGKSANAVKRVIALVLLAAITSPVWGPLLGALLHIPVSVVHGYMELRGGFWPFTEDKEVLVWKEIITGDIKNSVKIVITPAMSMGFWTVLGFYFGYSVSKR